MKRVVIGLLIGAFILSMSVSAECKERNNLYNMFAGKDVVRVYVADFTDSSGNSDVNTEVLKQTLENTLKTRIALNFDIVDKDSADIIIEADVFEMLWTDTDPVDNVYGLGAIAMDAAIKENYARIQINMRVIDAKNGEELWQRKVKATITDRTMTESDSVIMLPERVIKMFVKECFAKPKNARNRGMI